jgi:hypothetical protein
MLHVNVMHQQVQELTSVLHVNVMRLILMEYAAQTSRYTS